MNISTDYKDVAPDDTIKSEGYEWWYFDGLSSDGSKGFTVIFYYNNPFSTNKIKDLDNNSLREKFYPAISVSLYENGETVYYSFLEFEPADFSWNKKSKELQIGENRFFYRVKDESVSFHIQLKQELASGHKVAGDIKGVALSPPNTLIQSIGDKNHGWNLLTPMADIEIKLHLTGKRKEEEWCFSGKGYHDHNTGNEPMKESFKDWYWGRYHFKGYTLIYYLMNKHSGQQFKAWLIDVQNQSVLEHFDEAFLSYYSRNWFGIKSARKIDIELPQIFVNIQCKDKVDDGPFYQRFLGNSIIRYKGQVQAAQGISEYLCPLKIYNKWFWPLVHMRLRYMYEKPHWVQKSKILYPWTW